MKQTVPQVIMAGQDFSKMTNREIGRMCILASRSRQLLILELVEQYLAMDGPTLRESEEIFPEEKVLH